jgi:5-methyltetrahydrofolate--homocysteine methyltransferase
MVCDGAMGTQLQAADLTLDDFLNLEGRPDVLEHIHRRSPPSGSRSIAATSWASQTSIGMTT